MVDIADNPVGGDLDVQFEKPTGHFVEDVLANPSQVGELILVVPGMVEEAGFGKIAFTLLTGDTQALLDFSG